MVREPSNSQFPTFYPTLFLSKRHVLSDLIPYVTDETLAREERPKVGDVLLAGDLIGADFEDGAGQVEALGDGADHSVEEGGHER